MNNDLTKSRKSIRRMDSMGGKNKLRRMDTNQSNRSRRSTTTNAKKMPKNTQSMASFFEEEEEEVKEAHPYDQFFGEAVNKFIQSSTGGGIIGLTFSQFKEIAWPNVFPFFICDLVETMAGFSMQQEI